MRTAVIVLAFLAPLAHADQPTPQAPQRQCLDVPPDVRAAWHLKPTDCLDSVPVLRACDVTLPDIAKRLGLNLKCPNWPEQKK